MSNNLITENTIYGLGIAILFTIFFQVIAKLLFDDPNCNKYDGFYLGTSSEEQNRCKIINDQSKTKRIIFLMFIILSAMIIYHYTGDYRSIQMGVGIGSIFLLLATLCFEWRNNSNKMNALLTGIGIIVLGGFSIKNL